MNARLNQVDAAQAAVRSAQADVGVRHSAALAAQDSLKTLSTTLEGPDGTGVEDKALAQAVLDLHAPEHQLPGSPRRHREGPAADPDGLPPMSFDLAFTVAPFGLEPLRSFTLEPVDRLPTACSPCSARAPRTPGSSPRPTCTCSTLPCTCPTTRRSSPTAGRAHRAGARRGGHAARRREPGRRRHDREPARPVVVNARTGVGAQFILEDQDLPLRAELARS